jgi:hypothetical protein
MLMSFDEKNTHDKEQREVKRLDTHRHPMCCVTLQRRELSEFLYIPRPTFVIPIFRAPTTSSTIRTTISTERTSTSQIFSAILKQERKQAGIATTLPSNMISQRIFENLVLTNTIVAAFCIVLMVTITGFLIFLLIPSIRRRWLNDKPREDERKHEDLSSLSRQPSFHHFTLGPSRLNPLFEPTAGTTTTTQFGTLFQPHATTTTLLHPAIWTPISPASIVSTPIPSQQPKISSTPPSSMKTKPTTTTTTAPATAARPPLPSHPPTTIHRSPRKR